MGSGDDSLRSVSHWLHYGLLALIVVLAAYLRLTMLNQQSLWFDEADIVVRAQRPWSDILSTFTVQGENGPLYNVMLAVWIRIAGISETAVRFPSAVAGILAIPAIYLLARRLAGPQAGLIAAGLLAINPYHLWYSQEAKMYSIVALLSILSTFLLVEGLMHGDRRVWVGYAVATTFMFYTHVATVLIFAAQALFVLATYRNWRDQQRTLLVVASVLTLPYLPIALWAAKVVGGEVPTWHGDVSLTGAIRTIGTRFTSFRSTAEVEFRARGLYFLAAAGTAIWLVSSRRRRNVGLLLTTLVAVPVIGLWIVSLRNSVFSDRYIIGALPAYLTLVAIGLASLARHRVGVVPATLLAVLIVCYTWYPVTDVNRSASAEKEDWRSAYARVAERAEPDDVFLIHPGYMVSTLAYYGQRDDRLGGHPIGDIPGFAPDWMTRDVMVDMLREEFGRFDRFWLIESPDRVPLEDPDDELETWLRSTGTVLYEEKVNGVHLLLFEMPPDW
ncbi:MAG: glycosyltransferase family 39 protein [Thermomicrobiales bacterium]